MNTMNSMNSPYSNHPQDFIHQNPSLTVQPIPYLVLTLLGFFGIAGINRLYAGKIGTGILWLITGGIFGIGTIYDLVIFFMNRATDSQGRVIYFQ